MSDELRKALERARAKPAPKVEGPKIDMDLFREVERVRPGLIVELSKKLDVTRNAVYWMLRPTYGHNRRAQKSIQRFNEILKSIKEEIRNSLNQ
jgi:hypothetical protein